MSAPVFPGVKSADSTCGKSPPETELNPISGSGGKYPDKRSRPVGEAPGDWNGQRLPQDLSEVVRVLVLPVALVGAPSFGPGRSRQAEVAGGGSAGVAALCWPAEPVDADNRSGMRAPRTTRRRGSTQRKRRADLGLVRGSGTYSAPATAYLPISTLAV
jgi:hypothetical protein